MRKIRTPQERERIKACLREMWPTMWPSDVARALGENSHYLIVLASYMGLTHSGISPEDQRRHQIEVNRRNIARSLNKECRARQAKKLRQIYKMECERVFSGERQQTRLKIRTIPTRLWNRAYTLRYRYGYFVCKDEPLSRLYYDKDTRRRPLTGIYSEQWYKEKYGFEFVKFD